MALWGYVQNPCKKLQAHEARCPDTSHAEFLDVLSIRQCFSCMILTTFTGLKWCIEGSSEIGRFPYSMYAQMAVIFKTLFLLTLSDISHTNEIIFTNSAYPQLQKYNNLTYPVSQKLVSIARPQFAFLKSDSLRTCSIRTWPCSSIIWSATLRSPFFPENRSMPKLYPW